MNKFENVDILNSLEAIMRRNTAFYTSDFDIDKDIIQMCAVSENPKDHDLLWLSRPAGTFCCVERNVFMKDTRSSNTWCFYGEQTCDKVLAYAMKLAGVRDGEVMGNLYELDYAKHWQHVEQIAKVPESVTVSFHDGTVKEMPFFDYQRGGPHGNSVPQSVEFNPKNKLGFEILMNNEKLQHLDLMPGNFKDHLQKIEDCCVCDEAARIQARLQQISTPNSPNKTHFMVQISPEFQVLASSKAHDGLFKVLPYKSLILTDIKNETGIFATIKADEDRTKPLRPIRRQKAAIAKETTHKKKEMER